MGYPVMMVAAWEMMKKKFRLSITAVTMTRPVGYVPLFVSATVAMYILCTLALLPLNPLHIPLSVKILSILMDRPGMSLLPFSNLRGIDSIF